MSDLTKQQEDLYRKIRGLLRKAEATNYEAEANVFIKKAQELMFTHAVDEETLWASEPDKRPKPIFEYVTIKKNAVGSVYYRIILNACAKYNRCKMWYKGSQNTICGFESDVTFVMMLYASIVNQMSLSMAIGLGNTEENAKTYRANFLHAFSYEIADRLRESNREVYTAAHKAHNKALVLSRDHQIEQFMREQGIYLTSGGSHSSNARYSESAQSAGAAAAKSVDISGGRSSVGSTQRKAING